MTISSIISILAEILDVDINDIQQETYVIRELQAESIDLLEIGVAMQHQLGIPVDDDTVFLTQVRIILARAETQGTAAIASLQAAYPHLSQERCAAILADLAAGPVLQVCDLVGYAEHASKSA